MLDFAGLSFHVLALGTLASLVNALQFKFTEVRQCEPITISFDGTDLINQTIATNLTIIPLNSTLINIPVDPSYVSTGIYVNFLPLPAGSNFLAALDDSTGENLIPLSDLIRVLPSPGISISTCIAAMNAVAPRRFSLATNVSQCEEMTIMYDTSVVFRAPSVRLYNPKGVSLSLDSTFDDPHTGTAKYLVSFPRGEEIVLLMDDGNGIQETSPLITVEGDSTSDVSCIMKNLIGNMTSMTVANDQITNTATPSRAIIIGSVVGGSVLLFITLSMIVFVVRDRRRRQNIRLSNSHLEKQTQGPNIPPTFTVNVVSPSSQGSYPDDRTTVINPIYTNKSFLSASRANHRNSDVTSWRRQSSEGQVSPSSPSRPASVVVHTPRTAERISLESLDIEGMLNMAAVQTENMSSRKNSAATIFGLSVPPLTLSAPRAIAVRPQISQRHLRNPSDVPAGPDSMTFSGYSVNPFDGHTSITPSILQDSLVLTPPSGSPLTSPILPHDKNSSNSRIGSAISNRSSSDWYGIAR